MPEFYSLTGELIAFLKGLRYGGISAWDVMTWGFYVSIAFILVWYFFSGLRGGGDE